jgi:ABC-type polysaccharide/polyol phosphate export permease
MTGGGTAVPVMESTPPHWWKDLIDGTRETWRARNLIYQLTVRDIRVRYKEAVMGLAWAVVMPTLIILSGLVVRVALSSGLGGTDNSGLLLSLATKGLAWGFFSGAVAAGTSSLTGSSYLVSRVYFPRAALPISATLTQAFDTGIAVAAFSLALPWSGARFSAALLWVPLLLLLLGALTLAANLLFSCLNVFFRDIKYLVQVLLTFGIFFTPVFFDAAILTQRQVKILMFNPLAPLFEGLILVIGKGHNLLEPLVVLRNQELVTVWLPQYLGYSAVWALGGLLVAAALFRRAESLFADFV